MKAYELRTEKGLKDFTALQVTDREQPHAGPGEVVVRVRAASLNYRDILVAKGASTRSAPLVPLSDAAGEIAEVGPGVTRVAVGDRVAGSFFQSWIAGEFQEAHHASALGGAIDGVLAEYVRLRADAVVKLPGSISFEEGSTLPCAGLTAWNALFTAGAPLPGDTVLVEGTGGVSIFGLQFAKAAGANVVVTSSSDAKLDRARSLGATTLINYSKTPKWGEEARQRTGGRGVDHVLEVGGPGTLNQALTATRVGGAVSIIGVLTGFSGEVQTSAILHKALRLRGIYVGSVEMFEAMVRAIEAHQIKPVVDRVFAFAEAKEAYAHLASGQHLGKVVIRV